MLRKLWLVFAQACTLCVAALFVVSTLRPDLLPRFGQRGDGGVVLLQETSTPLAGQKIATFADAAKKAMPAVVNIYTSKEMRQRHPLLDDSMLRRYFPDLAERLPRQRATSLGSGVIVASEGYVLTNHHVIEGADDIQLVLADGRRIQARVRGTDPDSDLAVLQAADILMPRAHLVPVGKDNEAHVEVTREIEAEGFSREIIRRIQQTRKEMKLDVEEFIKVEVRADAKLADAFRNRR